MKRSIFKPILFGVLFGAAAFFAPFFLLKAMLFILLIGFICRLFWWRSGHWHHYRMQYHMAYADRVRGMTDEQYNEFKSKAAGYDCYDNHSCCGGRERKNETRSGTNEAPVENK